jgi:hypothetical protein
MTGPEFKRLLRRILLTAILGLTGASALAFAIDYAVFRIRVATNHNAFGWVTVRHYYAVLEKNGKTTFMFDPPQPWPCVNSLFPHARSFPCWYLRRHPEQRTDI